MKNLYYATFDKGYEKIVQKIIKKQDKSAFIKRLYTDAVLVVADEHFHFSSTVFYDVYQVIDYMENSELKVIESQKKSDENNFDSAEKKLKIMHRRGGKGGISSEIKRLLSRKDLKIFFPKQVTKLRVSYLSDDNQKPDIDASLKNAFETMIKKITKRQIGYFGTNGELSVISKSKGDCIFAKKITDNNYPDITSSKLLSPQKAFALNFLSDPVAGEVSLDPFSFDGIISFVRAYSFRKSNVIANEPSTDRASDIRLLAKKLKEKSFSVMNYDFLSDKFPIKFIDKIVTRLPISYSITDSFFDKANKLGVKTIVALSSRTADYSEQIKDKYKVTENFACYGEQIFRFDIIK